MTRRSCDHAIAQVYFYLDGEMTWIKRLLIKRHLRSCRDCTSAYSFENHLKEIVRERMQEEPQPQIIDRFRAFLRENESDFDS